MQRALFSIMLALACLVTYPVFGANEPQIHLDRKKITFGCGTCHSGFAFGAGGGPESCILCHSDPSKRPLRAVGGGLQPKNVTKEFAKNFRHPTFDKRGVHSGNETLPETSSTAVRHADCSDCHNVHYMTSEKPYAGILGKRVGNTLAEVAKEFELCYRCHSTSLNLPPRSYNKKMEFSMTNLSYHPVEGEGRNTAVVSLLRPYREKKINPGDISVITCSDCHASDDAMAPRGPHGSKYRGLLVENYEIGDNQYETAYSYALCYRCHKRSSILGNESFPYHSRHITGERNFKGGGTSCHTCHNSHGSVENRNLIKFNRDYVTESSSGKLGLVEQGVSTFHGECWLTCHGVDHNPKRY